jgi:large subunit ribosomal protein L21
MLQAFPDRESGTFISRELAMYAIIETGGKQFRVSPDGRVRVPSLPGSAGDRVTFERVLVVSAGAEDDLRLGNPHVAGARVVGEIVGHGRGKKITVFKYKRRHRYRRKIGHRQGYTEVAITAVELAGADREGSRAEASWSDAPTDAGTPGSGEGTSGGVGPHVCADCGRGFASERGLHQHRAKAHA